MPCSAFDEDWRRDDLPFPSSKEEFRAFEKFDNHLREAQSSQKDVLSSNVNQAARVATDMTTQTGVKHVVRRLSLVAKDSSLFRETAVYTVDSILRHAAKKKHKALQKLYEAELQAELRNMFRRALQDSKEDLAQRFFSMLVYWKDKGWFRDSIDGLAELVHRAAPSIGRPQRLKEKEDLPSDDEMDDDKSMAPGYLQGATSQKVPYTPMQGMPMTPVGLKQSTVMSSVPATPMIGVMQSVPATPANGVMGSVPATPMLRVMESVPATPGIGFMQSVPSTPAAGLVMQSMPATPAAGAIPGSVMQSVPATPALGAPMTPNLSTVPQTPPFTSGQAAPATPVHPPFTPAGPAPSTPAGRPAAPFTPAGPPPGTPAGRPPATPGPVNNAPFTPAGPPPGTPAGPPPATPGSLNNAPFTPAGHPPGTPAGPPPATPGSLNNAPFTPAGPPPGTPAGLPPPSPPPSPGSVTRHPNTPSPTVQPFTPLGPPPPTPAGRAPPATAAVASSTAPHLTRPPPRGAVVAGIAAPAPGTPGFVPVEGGERAPMTPVPCQAPSTPTPAPGTPGFRPFSGGTVAPSTPAWGGPTPAVEISELTPRTNRQPEPPSEEIYSQMEATVPVTEMVPTEVETSNEPSEAASKRPRLSAPSTQA